MCFFSDGMVPRFRLDVYCHICKMWISEGDFEISAEIEETEEGINKSLFENVRKNMMLIPPIIIEVFKKHFPELAFGSERDKEIEIREYKGEDRYLYLWHMDERPFSDLTEDEKIHKASEIIKDISEGVIALIKGDK